MDIIIPVTVIKSNHHHIFPTVIKGGTFNFLQTCDIIMFFQKSDLPFKYIRPYNAFKKRRGFGGHPVVHQYKNLLPACNPAAKYPCMWQSAIKKYRFKEVFYLHDLY